MRFFVRTVPLLLISVLVGCGDSPHTLLRELINTENETADMMGRVSSEADAEYYLKFKGKDLQDRFKKIQEKWKKVFPSDEKDEKKILEWYDIFDSYKDEMMATGKRLGEQSLRLQALRSRLYSEMQAAGTKPDGQPVGPLDQELLKIEEMSKFPEALLGTAGGGGSGGSSLSLPNLPSKNQGGDPGMPPGGGSGGTTPPPGSGSQPMP